MFEIRSRAWLAQRLKSLKGTADQLGTKSVASDNQMSSTKAVSAMIDVLDST